MSNDAVETNNVAKQSPPEPKAALEALLASLEHHGTPATWPAGLYEQAQLAALRQGEEESGNDEEIVEAARDAARDLYGSDDVDFDKEPTVSVGDDGAYVSAWVFVPRASLPMWTVDDADAESTPPPDGGHDAS
ncbi:hypothetical protein [Myxococcus eversor]|uniref:hypothetical protein n=1 Tax=Myxococcus eversor TaxID=2709661 RepID=UPI0013D2B399|nr:hypothetical protein [Myxococcus eversor]